MRLFPLVCAFFVACSALSLILERKRAPAHWDYFVDVVGRAFSEVSSPHQRAGFCIALVVTVCAGPLFLGFELVLLAWVGLVHVRHGVRMWLWERRAAALERRVRKILERHAEFKP